MWFTIFSIVTELTETEALAVWLVLMSWVWIRLLAFFFYVS